MQLAVAERTSRRNVCLIGLVRIIGYNDTGLPVLINKQTISVVSELKVISFGTQQSSPKCEKQSVFLCVCVWVFFFIIII